MKCSSIRVCSQLKLAAIFYVMMLVSCSFVNKQQSLLDDSDISIPEAKQDCTIQLVADNENPPVPVDTFYKEQLNVASKFCFLGEFYRADSIYRQIIPRLNVDPDSVSDLYLNDIVICYAEIMPDTLAAPDDIASQVFLVQMMKTLDTLSFNKKDSMFVSRLVGRSSRVYTIPMVWNSRVEKSLYYYLTRNKITIENWKKNARRYLSFMKKMFADSALPQDLAYLPLIESGFNPKAYSRSHASGIWQFIPSTGKLYGLRNNYWLDERRDPVRATTAAIQYLKKLYGDFGNWHLALAAYNCGEGGLARAIGRSGIADYWQLRLPAETMNYVPLYLAALTIAKDPEFTNAVEDSSELLPFDTVVISDCVDMREIAAGIGVSSDTLKMLNPHILHWCTPPDMTNVQLYLPIGKTAEFKQFVAALPDDKKVRWYRYQVQAGDNLGSIARHFKLPVEGIQSVNKLRGSRIVAGHYLFIPIPVSDKSVVCSAQEMVHQDESVVVEAIPSDASLVVYEVKHGDNVWKLAELFGVTARQICGWNKIKKSRIQIGQILSIYTSNNTSPVVAATLKKSSASSFPPFATTGYVVRKGDNPYSIAQMFCMTIGDLYTLNGIDPAAPLLHPNETLQVKKIDTSPSVRNVATTGMIYIISPGDNLFRIAQNFSIEVNTLKSSNNITDASTIKVGDTLIIPAQQKQKTTMLSSSDALQFYTVKNGDNLWRIAQEIGISVEQLYAYNRLQANSVLMPGDTIRFVRKDDL